MPECEANTIPSRKYARRLDAVLSTWAPNSKGVKFKKHPSGGFSAPFTKNNNHVYTKKVPNGTRDWRPALNGDQSPKGVFLWLIARESINWTPFEGL